MERRPPAKGLELVIYDSRFLTNPLWSGSHTLFSSACLQSLPIRSEAKPPRSLASAKDWRNKRRYQKKQKGGIEWQFGIRFFRKESHSQEWASHPPPRDPVMSLGSFYLNGNKGVNESERYGRNTTRGQTR